MAGGAAIIDIKEPARGALGQADAGLVAQIVATVGTRCPVTMATGELLDPPNDAHLSFAGVRKVGLAGCAARTDWPTKLLSLADRLGAHNLVPVAYGDSGLACAPSPWAVLDFVLRHRCAAFMIDTSRKDGHDLLHWLSVADLEAMRLACLSARTVFAVAGSLSIQAIESILPMAPDIIAVRTAACLGGDRNAAIDPDAVRRLVEFLHDPARKFTIRTDAKKSTIRGKYASTKPIRASSSHVVS
jgi:uncharacterized protein (UPF0264 family)